MLVYLIIKDIRVAFGQMLLALKIYRTRSIIKRVLTRELRGECGAGGVLRSEGYDVTRGGETPGTALYKGGGLRRHKALVYD